MISAIRAIIYCVYALFSAAAICLSLYAILEPEIQRSGVLKVEDLTVQKRAVIGGLPDVSNLPTVPPVLSTLVASASAGIASRASSVASEVAGAAESALARLQPQALTVGTKYVCATFRDNEQCVSVPLNGSDPLSSLASLVPGLSALVAPLQHMPDLRIFFWLGAAGVVAQVVARLLALHIIIALCPGVLAVVFFLVPAAFVLIMYNVASHLAPHSTSAGFLVPSSVVILVSSASLLGLHCILKWL